MYRFGRPYRLEVVNNSDDLSRTYATQFLTEDARQDLAKYVAKLGYPCIVLQFTGAGAYFNDLIHNGRDVTHIWRNIIADCHALPKPKKSLILLHNFEGLSSKVNNEIISNIESWGLIDSGNSYCEVFEKVRGACANLWLFWMQSES